jgi:hypothetical protein
MRQALSADRDIGFTALTTALAMVFASAPSASSARAIFTLSSQLECLDRPRPQEFLARVKAG